MATLRRSAVFVVLGLALVPGRALAAEGATHPQDQIVLSGAVVVPRGQEIGEIVVFHGNVTVQGVARGDVVVIDGRVTVIGQVSGTVVSVDGTVVLGAAAQVGGSVLAGGKVLAEEGAQVGGDIKQGVSFTLREPLRAIGRFVVWLAVSVSTLLLGFALLLLAPRGADAVHRAASSAPWASLGWGVAAFLGVPALAGLLLVSVLGLPLGLTLLLAFAFLLFVGYAWSAWIVGRLLWGPPRNRPVALLIGWATLSAATMIPYAGGILWFVGAVFGLGAVVVATWRARGTRGRHRAGVVAAPYVTEEAMEEEGVGL